MTFFDKFFTTRNRNSKGENGFKLGIEPVRPSVFEVTKDQIRVVLFRECDRRGRKLLFDSNAVEKLPLGSHVKAKEYLYKTKIDQIHSGKFFDFVEVTNSHGYKYKKPSNDVTLLEEMIFGSVAMVFKGGSMCKIHSLASPKCVMFTNIVLAPEQCHYQLSSDNFIIPDSHSSSGTSINEYSNDGRTSSSDSKLYRHKGSYKCCTSTYPCMKHKSLHKKFTCHCEVNSISSTYLKKCDFHECFNSDGFEKVSFNLKCTCGQISYLNTNASCEIVSVNEKDGLKCSELSLNASQEKDYSKCKCDSADKFNNFYKFYQCSKGNFSNPNNSLNSPLGSLRRRWMQSCSSSVEEACCDETENLKNKTRTKLGMGLVVDLTNNLEDELEKFLFNHTIVIESILNKLQSSVETAYVKKENFVDLTYNAFINCQQSMYELITGVKYARPMWLTLNGAVVEESSSHVQDKMYSQFQENIKDCKQQDSLNNVKVKFLNDFCDVLIKFDTKDTNFFVSTLLTAILTHHLSWVTGVAESDASLPEHKLLSVIKNLRPYNPIWAQLNDLNGILGSPLKSVRTVIAGSETSKNSIASIIQVLTYFIRCYNVVENLYDFEFDDVTRLTEDEVKSKEGEMEHIENLDCKISCTYAYVSKLENLKKNDYVPESKANNDWTRVEIPEISIPAADSDLEHRCLTREVLQKSCSAEGMKRSKSFLSRLEEEESNASQAKLFSSIDDLRKFENTHGSCIGDNMKNEDVLTNNYLCTNEECSRKLKKLIRVPSKAVICHIEKNLSPDEGYDTVDSYTVAETYPKEKVGVCNPHEQKKDDVLFVLGENEELVNVKGILREKPSNLILEGGESTNFIFGCKKVNLCRSKSINIPVPDSKDVGIEKSRTFHNGFKDISDGTLLKDNIVAQEHSQSHKEVDVGQNFISILHELPMPRASQNKYVKRRLDISSVLGNVNDRYNSEQIIQGVLEDKSEWEEALRKDLALYAHNHVLDRNVTEALCIIGDMNSWEVTLFSSNNFTIDRNNFSGVRIGMSQLVADMLESLLHICRIKLPPDFCLGHIEKKLHEIYTKSKSVAELLNSTEMCSIEYLTSRLDISVNDVPLLLSVATTHSPHLSFKYGLTFT